MAKLENIQLLNKMIEEKMINVQHHPSADLTIYNYSKICMLSHTWNEVSEICRGLICDSDMNIKARPLKKFFNYEEVNPEDIPSLPFVAYDKLDGSMGTLYWVDDTPYIATRGSFVSEQAIHATEVLHTKYAHVIDKLNRDYTYVFEIIYPEDAHVVHYDDMDDIVLIAIINTETGDELDVDTMEDYFNIPTKYDGCKDLSKIREMFSGDNREGFVIKFSNDYRIKLKYDAYLKLFNAKYFLTEKKIFAAMQEGNLDSIRDVIKDCDEEIRIFFESSLTKFHTMYAEIEAEAKAAYRDDFADKKEAAAYFLKNPLYGILFKMYDGKPYDYIIWDMVKNRL